MLYVDNTWCLLNDVSVQRKILSLEVCRGICVYIYVCLSNIVISEDCQLCGSEIGG